MTQHFCRKIMQKSHGAGLVGFCRSGNQKGDQPGNVAAGPVQGSPNIRAQHIQVFCHDAVGIGNPHHSAPGPEVVKAQVGSGNGAAAGSDVDQMPGAAQTHLFPLGGYRRR